MIQNAVRSILRNLMAIGYWLFPFPYLLRFFRFAGAYLKIPLPVKEARSCLNKSLLELYALSGQGISGRLAIGVKKEEGKLSAHAWVEKEGEAFEEKDGYKKLGTL